MNAASRLYLLCVLVLAPAAAQLHAQILSTPFAIDSVPQPRDSAEPPEPNEELESDEIETDRDSFTPATTTAGDRRLIVESAWSFIDNRTVPDTNSLPELVTRYGVNDWLELRLGWNWEAGGAANAISSSGGNLEETEAAAIERDSQLFYGLKAALTDQNDLRPQSALILQAGTPTFGHDTATQLVATYVAGWQFANRWKWDSALRYGYDSSAGDHFNLWAPSTVLKIPLGESWTVHGEYFGVMSQGRVRDRSQHYFSPGIHYLLTRDLEIGIRVGWGLNDQSADYFNNIGLGWRY
jgi:hypothetical protein